MDNIFFKPDNFLNENIGIQNNNPGNIRYRSDINWLGQTGQSNGFVKFDSLPYGYRALMKNLQYYITHENKDTIAQMITRWAPPQDGNNTESYIMHVAERSGINPNARIAANDFNSLAKIASAIAISETGTKNDLAISQAIGLMGLAGAQQKPQVNELIKPLKTILVITLLVTAANKYLND
jgi:hypothetical protein